MKAAICIVLVLVGYVAALQSCASRREDVAISNFSWHLAGDTAPFSFELENATAQKIEVIVFLIAESKSEGHEGTKIREVGRQKIQVLLGARETRKLSGNVRLVAGGDIVIYPLISVKRPNQPPEPTAMSVTPRAGARVAPAMTVAHL